MCLIKKNIFAVSILQQQLTTVSQSDTSNTTNKIMKTKSIEERREREKKIFNDDDKSKFICINNFCQRLIK